MELTMTKWQLPAIALIGFLLVSPQHVAVAQSNTEQQTSGDVLTLRDDAPQEYVVKKGDTLWDISEMYLNDPWYWPELWRINEDVANPHLIYPGDKLTLVWIDGKPQLTRKEYVALLPQGEVKDKGEPIPTFSREMLAPLLTEHRLITTSEKTKLPQVLGDNRGAPRVNGMLPVFIKGHVEKTTYSVFTPIEKLPQGELLRYVGDVDVTFNSGELAEGELSRIQREIRRGDYLMDARPLNIPEIITPMPGNAIDGQVIASLNSRKEQGKYDVVMIDKGRADGVEVGQMYQAIRPGSTVFVEGEEIKLVNFYKPADDLSRLWRNTVQLPVSATAEMMVLEVQETTSFAMVLRSREWLSVGDYFIPKQF
ncbi:LysM domain-containing protein [Pseudidiomarina gelatinasegens]|uniref:LysM domain-containing protein n=2 Tax=Pseudidiomarina gelatinasegens TaxID=2487740 RepID=A0A443YZE3_9GAMM|nr:LysM domain-containing protein [Pseudidiomarina gelatinasegens]